MVFALVLAMPPSITTEALRAEALGLGFTFEAEGWAHPGDAPLLETSLFGVGWRGRRDLPFTNLMTSSQKGLKVNIFDYTYFTGGRKNARVYRQTVGAFSKAGVHIRCFELRPSGITDKIWGTLEHKNIDFETDPEFSRRYVLRGALDDEVKAFFTLPLRAFLESLDPNEKWHIEGNGDTLVVYRFKQRTPPAEFRTFYEQTTSIASSFFDLVTPTTIKQ